MTPQTRLQRRAAKRNALGEIVAPWVQQCATCREHDEILRYIGNSFYCRPCAAAIENALRT